MSLFKTIVIVVSVLTVTACAQERIEHDPSRDLAIQWALHSAEYKALTTQVYQTATAQLPDFIEDKTWNALTGYGEASALPPAVILDVDETVVSNAEFQLTHERPFANHKLDTWARNTQAVAIPGVKNFVDTARSLGVTVFFLTNRPCQRRDGSDDACPQKQTTIDGIREIGIEVDAEHVLLAGEKPGWDREKSFRRNLIAETHRVLMVIGDDLSDFIPCVRAKPYGDCTGVATRAGRTEALEKYQEFWGHGWYILPNPMHGSWTSVE